LDGFRPHVDQRPAVAADLEVGHVHTPYALSRVATEISNPA
jgi:hypothetical protein